ncbi:hypothetical protein FRC03_001138 [Tulasnella sp. 419]|nr:hypothetical protein FRC03_001138 [Tulasnella sp. 419]
MVLYGLIAVLAYLIASVLAQSNGMSTIYRNVTYDDTVPDVLFGADNVCDSRSCMPGSSPPWVATRYQDPYTKQFVTFHTTSQRRARDSGGIPYVSFTFQGAAIYLYTITSRSSRCVYNVTLNGGQTWETIRNNFTTGNLTQNRLAWFKEGLDASQQSQFVLRFWANADGWYSLDGVDEEGGSLNLDRLMITQPSNDTTSSPITMSGIDPTATASLSRSHTNNATIPLIVGLSVGIPLLFILLLTLSILWYMSRRQRIKEGRRRESRVAVLGAGRRTSTDDIDGSGGQVSDDAPASRVEPFVGGLSDGNNSNTAGPSTEDGNPSMASSPTLEDRNLKYMEQVHPTMVSVANGIPTNGSWPRRAQISPLHTNGINYQSITSKESPTTPSSPGRKKSPTWATPVVDPIIGVEMGYGHGLGLGLNLARSTNGEGDADTRRAVENEAEQRARERKLARDRGGSLSLANPNLTPSTIDEAHGFIDESVTTDGNHAPARRDSPESFLSAGAEGSGQSKSVRKSRSLPDALGAAAGNNKAPKARRPTAADAPQASAPPPYTTR